MDEKDYIRICREAESPIPSWIPHEYMIKKGKGKEVLPTEGIPVGSSAYKHDMSEMYLFNGEEWNVMGGGGGNEP